MVFGVSSLTRTRLDVTVLVLHRRATACDGGTLPLWSGAGSPTGAVAFGTTLWAARPGLPWRPAGARDSNHWCLQELFDKGYREKKERVKRGKKKFQVKLKSQIYAVLSDWEYKQFKERYEACRFTQRLWLCQQAYFSVCPSHKLYLSLSCIPQFPAVAVSSVLSVDMPPPPRRLTGGDR